MIWLCAALIAGALAAVCVWMLRTVCIRARERDMTDPDNLRSSPYAPLAERMLAGVAFCRAHKQEDVWITSFDGLRLHASLVQHPQAKGTILLFHGYRSSWAVDFSISIPFYYALGFSLLVIDQRSHGQSEGRFITFGVRERRDACLWAAYAAARFGPRHTLYLGGLSMGATTVLMAAGLPLPEQVRGIVADCGFTSPDAIIRSVIKKRYPFLPVGPAAAVLNVLTVCFAGFGLREASATEAVRHAQVPVLFLHGTGDTFVPWQMTQEAFDACAAEKRLLLVDGAEHGMSYLEDPARVQSLLEEFFESHLIQEE